MCRLLMPHTPRGFAICQADQPAPIQTKARCMTALITCITSETLYLELMVLFHIQHHYKAYFGHERTKTKCRRLEDSLRCSGCRLSCTVRELITRLEVTAFCSAGSFIIHSTALWLNAFMLHVITLFMRSGSATMDSSQHHLHFNPISPHYKSLGVSSFLLWKISLPLLHLS